MGLTRSLTDGEAIELDLRPHWHQVAIPALLLPLTVGVTTYLLLVVPHGGLRAPLRWTIGVLAFLVLIRWVARPIATWLATRYVVTDRRVILRTGVVRRHGRDIPLARINDVSFDSRLGERLWRCGTLTIESAGENGRVVLHDIPGVEGVAQWIYSLAEAESTRRRGAAALE